MTPAQIQTLIDACRTSPTDLVTWLELKAVLEGLKNQDLGLTLTTTGTSGPATLDIDTDILNIPNYSTDLTVYVPYTGANQNVNLGEYGIRSGWYQLDLTPTGTPTSASTMYWDDNQKTVALVMGGTTQEIGHDQFYHAKNSTGTTIPKGTAVRFAGTDGGSGHLLITPFLADGSNPSSYFMGVTSEEITNGSFGKVQSFGRLDGIDTSAFAEGDILYASTTVAGGFQTTVPQAPNNIVQVAAVISDSNNGKLLIRPTLGSKLTSDESVKLTSVANGNVLQYNSTLAVWENVAPTSLAVSNIYTANGTLTGNRTVTSGGFSVNYTGSVFLATSAGRVGIGTTAIASSADVRLLLNSAAGAHLGFGYNGTSASLIGSPNLSTMAFYTSTGTLGSETYTERMRIASNGIVSIGTTSSSSTPDVRLLVNGQTGGFVGFAFNGGPGGGIGSPSGSTLSFMTSSGTLGSETYSERMRIFSNGNIGINTTTDAGFRLDVNGTMRVQGAVTTSSYVTFTANSSSGITPSANTVSIEFFGARDVTNAYRFGYRNNMDVSNSTRNFFTFGETFLTYTYTGGTNIGRIINFSHIINTTGGTNIITAIHYNPTLTSTTGTTHRFLHNITGDVLLCTTSGYVGIGATADTSYKLSVDGDLRVYGNIRTAQPTGGTGVGVWRLGSTATGTFTLDATTCVEIEIGGSLVKLATVS